MDGHFLSLLKSKLISLEDNITVEEQANFFGRPFFIIAKERGDFFGQPSFITIEERGDFFGRPFFITLMLLLSFIFWLSRLIFLICV